MKLALVVALALALAVTDRLSPGRRAGQDQSASSSSASSVVDGYKFDQYRNLDYPCSISGYQTFVIGTKVGSSDTVTRPLWVRMRGGGVGFFDSAGNPQPSAGNKSEESAATSIGFVRDTGLMRLVRADARGVPAGVGLDVQPRHLLGRRPARPEQPEHAARRHRPRRSTACSRPRRRSSSRGRSTRPASSSCTARAPARRGRCRWRWAWRSRASRPRAPVVDSGVVNLEWERAQFRPGHLPRRQARGPGALAAIQARTQFQLADIKNEPDKLVSRGELTVPLLHTWSRADPNVCGATPMSCPLRDGSSVTLGRRGLRPRAAARGHRRPGPGLEVAQPARVREPGRAAGKLRDARGDQQETARTPTPPSPPTTTGRSWTGCTHAWATRSPPGAQRRREALNGSDEGSAAAVGEGVPEEASRYRDGSSGTPSRCGHRGAREAPARGDHPWSAAVGWPHRKRREKPRAGRPPLPHPPRRLRGRPRSPHRARAHHGCRARLRAQGGRQPPDGRRASRASAKTTARRRISPCRCSQPDRAPASTPTPPPRSAPKTSRNATASRAPPSRARCWIWPMSFPAASSSAPSSRPR